jgi:hypothetical protein
VKTKAIIIAYLLTKILLLGVFFLRLEGRRRVERSLRAVMVSAWVNGE